ncbi:MAG: GIY-YIG nuclease family protein [Coraliomargarita sp.]
MSNTAYDSLVKLGITYRNPVVRAKELNCQTANPGKFIPQMWFRTQSPEEHERRIFEALSACRPRKCKEFLKMEVVDLAVCLSWYFERNPDFIQSKIEDEYLRLRAAKSKAS